MTPASFLLGFVLGVLATVGAVVLAGGIFAAVLWRGYKDNRKCSL